MPYKEYAAEAYEHGLDLCGNCRHSWEEGRKSALEHLRKQLREIECPHGGDTDRCHFSEPCDLCDLAGRPGCFGEEEE